MYAIIATGGKQLRVEVGEVVRVEHQPVDVGQEIVFDRVLMVGGDDDSRVGNPTLDGAKVRGSVVAQGRDKKVLVYTYKRRKNSARKSRGHRQAVTSVKIEAIEG
jgi:large subunit ribosomal protein L21